MRTWWKALARLRAARPRARQAATGKANGACPGLEPLECRTLLSNSSGEAIVAGFTRYLADPSHSAAEVGVSRFDPHTGHETVLFSKQGAVYESIGSVAVAPDGDVLFALTEIPGGPASVREIDARTGKTTTLFTTPGLEGLAVGPHDQVVVSWSRWSTHQGGFNEGVSRFDPHTGHETVLFSKQEGDV